MTIKLHRFPLSHYSEKVRAILVFKALDYVLVEHRLGLPQLGIVRLSGQRKLPVIEHEGSVVFDSTQIALYLERTFPERRRLLPADEAARREVLSLEERIDRAFAIAPVLAGFDALRDDLDTVGRALAVEVYGVGPRLGRLLARLNARAARLGLGRGAVERAQARTRALLGELDDRLARSRYLVGDAPTLADFAAVGLTLHLEYPRSRHLGVPELAGLGAPGWADDPRFARFFAWRRRFYEELLD
ncbi:MAG: glutathione S-transferase family protein [Sorangiineae bacterium]|nr:glutathione S-transferase family protein [Sorangiineae bacterium]MEB2343333.1 glutathione S-transferase family protein [Deltaproteobacteria bacterium]